MAEALSAAEVDVAPLVALVAHSYGQRERQLSYLTSDAPFELRSRPIPDEHFLAVPDILAAIAVPVVPVQGYIEDVQEQQALVKTVALTMLTVPVELANIDSASTEVIQEASVRLVTRAIQVTHPHSNRVTAVDPVVHTRVAIFPNGSDYPQRFHDRQVAHSNYYSCLLFFLCFIK